MLKDYCAFNDDILINDHSHEHHHEHIGHIDHLHHNCVHDINHHNHLSLDHRPIHLNHMCKHDHPPYDFHSGINVDFNFDINCNHKHDDIIENPSDCSCLYDHSIHNDIHKLQHEIEHLNYYIQHMNTNPFLNFNNNIFDASAFQRYVDSLNSELEKLIKVTLEKHEDDNRGIHNELQDLSGKIQGLRESLMYLIGTGNDLNKYIDTFKDVLNFLKGYSDETTLKDVLEQLKQDIESELIKDEKVIAKALTELRAMIGAIIDSIDMLEI